MSHGGMAACWWTFHMEGLLYYLLRDLLSEAFLLLFLKLPSAPLEVKMLVPYLQKVANGGSAAIGICFHSVDIWHTNFLGKVHQGIDFPIC